jgi:acyl-CoA reductase-like NAD-dependent aldehyde dehydrogenase
MPVVTEIKKQYDNVEKWARPDKPPFDLTWAPFRRAIAKEPKGTVLIICPFNYPVWVNFVPLVSVLFPAAKPANSHIS